MKFKDAIKMVEEARKLKWRQATVGPEDPHIPEDRADCFVIGVDPRDGERKGYNNLSLTVKRVTQDYQGNEASGVCSNYLCDLKKGDKVDVIGPFGSTFLMPNHPNSHLLMICTGTGSAPMRAMTEYRRRRRLKGATGKLMLFFGARTKEELPYFGPLVNLPKDFIDTTLALSRAVGQPRRYVQDAMRERAEEIGAELDVWSSNGNGTVFSLTPGSSGSGFWACTHASVDVQAPLCVHSGE